MVARARQQAINLQPYGQNAVHDSRLSSPLHYESASPIELPVNLPALVKELDHLSLRARKED